MLIIEKTRAGIECPTAGNSKFPVDEDQTQIHARKSIEPVKNRFE